MTDKTSKEYKAEYARKWRQANAEKHKTYQAWYHREVWYPHPANKRKQLMANRKYKAKRKAMEQQKRYGNDE